MSDSKEFQDAESVRSGNSHVTSRPVSFPPLSNSWRNAKPFYRNAEPQRRAAKHLGHIWFIGKRFCKSRCAIISTLSSIIESMEFFDLGAASFIHSGKEWKANTGSRSERPRWTVSQKFIFSGGDSPKNYLADQQRLQSSDLLFDKFPAPGTFACSQFTTEAMQWTKEVEMVDSVDDFKSSSSIRGISMPIFWSTWCEDCFSTEQNHR